jgi:hypothetical protein
MGNNAMARPANTGPNNRILGIVGAIAAAILVMFSS